MNTQPPSCNQSPQSSTASQPFMQNAPSDNPSPEQRASELALRLLNDYKLCKLDSLNELTAIIREREELKLDRDKLREYISIGHSWDSKDSLVMRLKQAEAERDTLKRENEALKRCLNFFASVIKCREPWTDTCEKEYTAAINAARKGTT